MNARDKAKAVADKLREETKSKEVKEEKELAKVESSLAQLNQDKDLSKMYQDNADVGASNLGGELPLLKVHQTGKSTKNELADGSEPSDGYFFYKPTGEQFNSITCHILTISRGFRAAGLDDKKDVFNQIMAGVIVESDFEQTGAVKPFVTYLTGLKLAPMWEFGKEARKYTKARPVPIPMFALKIKLTAEKVSNSYGKSWVIRFEILKDKEGNPLVIVDSILFQYLLDNVKIMEDTIENVIESKVVGSEAPEGEEPAGEPIPF